MPQHLTTADPLLTTTEAIDYLGGTISLSTLRRLIADGAIPTVRLSPKVVRIRVSALEAYLTSVERRSR